MQYRKFGKTEEAVSVLGFGCMRLPVIDADATKIEVDEATRMIRYAIDEGVNYIDTAYPYHGTGMGEAGFSEPFVGQVLKEGYREKVNLATKLPSWLIKTREDMDRYLNEQLERLDTNYIDFYLVHTLSKALWYPIKELGVRAFLDEAKASGKIKYAGFSFHDDSVELFKEIVDAYEWDFCQIQYNYLDENYQAGKEGLEYAAQKGLGIVIMEPLRGGSLAHKLPKQAQEMFLKADGQKTAVEWALKWIWNHPEVAVLLSGMSEMGHVIENVKLASEATLPCLNDSEVAVVDEVKQYIKERSKVGCTACGYCMPCPFGINIPKNFAIFNEYHFFDDEKTKIQAKNQYNNRLKKDEKASSCVDCGKCEKHCPQHIAIRKMLDEVAQTLAMEA